VTKTGAFLLTIITTALLDVAAARLPLPAMWGQINPIILLRLALVAGIGAALPRTTGIGATVVLLGAASVLPTIAWFVLYIAMGRAAPEYSGPAFVLAFLAWALATGVFGALAGIVLRRWSRSDPGTA